MFVLYASFFFPFFVRCCFINNIDSILTKSCEQCCINLRIRNDAPNDSIDQFQVFSIQIISFFCFSSVYLLIRPHPPEFRYSDPMRVLSVC